MQTVAFKLLNRQEGVIKENNVEDVIKDLDKVKGDLFKKVYGVGTEDVEDDGVSFEEKVAGISEKLRTHFAESIELQERIRVNLQKVGIEL